MNYQSRQNPPPCEKRQKEENKKPTVFFKGKKEKGKRVDTHPTNRLLKC
jgi:hypothetical protein